MTPRTFTITWLQAALGALALTSVMALAGSVMGYRIGHQAAAGVGAAKLQALRAQQAQEALDQTTAHLLQERAWTRIAQQAGAQLLTERETHAEETKFLKERIARVTSQYRPTPDAPLQPAPRCIFANGFVSVWNAAIGADSGPRAVPASVAAGGADGTTSADEALDSGVQQTDILEHHVDFGQRCRGIESQLNRLLDAIEVTQ